MTTLDRLIDQFMRAHAAGENPDPIEFVDRLAADDRTEGAERIEAVLRTVAAPVDPRRRELLINSPRGRHVAEALARSLRDEATLTDLREHAEMSPAGLAVRVADAVGLPERATKVDRRLGQLERGEIDASGLADRLRTALRECLDVSERALTSALDALAPRPSTAVAFAVPGPDPREAADEEWDEVDDLFFDH